MFHAPIKYRTKYPKINYVNAEGNNGFFVIPHYRIIDYFFYCVCSDGMGWEHVSVSIRTNKMTQTRCPTWEEMCWIKDLFWDKTDCIIQYHPAESEYINCHPFVLHLWRPTNQIIPIPDKKMVGPS